MKYFVILAVSLVLGFSISFSQVVINSSDIKMTNGQKIYERDLSIDSFANLKVGADMQWDFSNIALIGEISNYEFITPPENASFSTATHAQNDFFTLGGSGLFVPAITYYELNQDGYFELGSHYNYTFIPLNEDASANATVPEQSSLFMPTPRMGYSLPMVYNETEILSPVTVKRGLDLILNIPPTLKDAPFRSELNVQISYKTTGWGKLKLSGYEQEEDVIVLERTRSDIDSFFLYGSPAPEILLSGYGLEQGSRSDSRTLFFYAKGYPQAICVLVLNSEGNVTYAKQMSYSPTMSVENQDLKVNQLNVFPNPTNGDFTIDTKDFTDAKYIEVYSMNGELLLKKNLASGSSQTKLSLINAPNGSYIYSINKESGRSLSSGKLMISK